ncbi:MAG: hypothetical protein ACOY0T_40570 [Myxococcota bacterium]
MQLWLVLWASAASALVLLAFSAIDFEFDGRGFGDAKGQWAAAFGVVVCGVVLSGVCAKQAPARLELRVFGRTISLSKLLRRGPRKRREPKPTAQEERETPSKWRFGSAEVLELLLHKSAWLRVHSVKAELSYGFQDVALTGRLAGALYALAGALPPQVQLVQHVSWDGAERWEASTSGRVAVWPGRVLVDVLWAMLRARRRGSAQPVTGAAANEIERHSA